MAINTNKVWLNFKLSIIKAACVLLLSCLYPSFVEAQSGREIAEYASPSVVVLIAKNAKGKPLSLGTGFFVTEKIVATNNHVIEGASHIVAKIIGHKEVYNIERVLGIDPKKDLALLKITGIKASPLSLGVSHQISVGDEVYVIGNPQGLEGTFSKGIVSGIRSVRGNRYIQITAPISPGSSGGPVINTAGEVVGITVGTLKGGQNLNFAIPVSDLVLLLRQSGSAIEAGVIGNPSNSRDSGSFNQAYKAPLHPSGTKEIKLRSDDVRAHPNSAEAHYRLAEAYRRWLQYTEAISSYKRVIQIEPKYAEAFFGLGETYSKLAFYARNMTRDQYIKQGAEAYKQAIRIKPDYVEAHVGLGEVYESLNRDNEAIEAFKIAIRLKPDYADAYLNLGLLYMEAPEIAYTSGEEFIKERFGYQLQQAIDAFKQVLRIEPDILAYLNLGRTYLLNDQFGEGINALKQVIRITPYGSWGEAYFELCTAYKEFGRISEGVESFKQMVRNKPDGAWEHYSLGMMYVYQGDKSSALEEYKILKNLKKVPDIVFGGFIEGEKFAEMLFKEIYR